MANTLPCMDDKETIEDFTKRCEKDAQVKTYTYSAITEELKGQKVVDMEEISNSLLCLVSLMMVKVSRRMKDEGSYDSCKSS